MAKLTRARAEERAAALQAEYDAWHARAAEEGHDALALRRLIGRTRALLRQARRLGDTSGKVVTARLVQQLDTYRDAWTALMDAPGAIEAAEIDSLTDALLRGEAAAAERLAAGLVEGADAAEAAEVEALGLRASFLLGRYARHFAGRARVTRDALLLEDMQRYLTGIVERLVLRLTLHLEEPLMERIEVLTDQLSLWAEEAEGIGPMRLALPPRERMRALAELGDGLAREWEAQVDGYPAMTVRARLVKRLITAMEYVRVEQAALNATELLDEPDADAALLRTVERLAGWRERREQLRAGRRGATLEGRARALQAEVAECILQWAREVTGAAHSPERLVRMGELCDRLQELERQLDKATREGAGDASVRLLAYARARLIEWETAWENMNGR